MSISATLPLPLDRSPTSGGMEPVLFALGRAPWGTARPLFPWTRGLLRYEGLNSPRLLRGPATRTRRIWALPTDPKNAGLILLAPQAASRSGRAQRGAAALDEEALIGGPDRCRKSTDHVTVRWASRPG